MELPPIARRRDPETSKLAAEKVMKCGARARQENLVLGGVKLNPGLTTAELAVKIGTDRYVPARRMASLERQGLVRRSTDKRKCTVTGSPCLTWTAA